MSRKILLDNQVAFAIHYLAFVDYETWEFDDYTEPNPIADLLDEFSSFVELTVLADAASSEGWQLR